MDSCSQRVGRIHRDRKRCTGVKSRGQCRLHISTSTTMAIAAVDSYTVAHGQSNSLSVIGTAEFCDCGARLRCCSAALQSPSSQLLQLPSLTAILRWRYRRVAPLLPLWVRHEFSTSYFLLQTTGRLKSLSLQFFTYPYCTLSVLLLRISLSICSHQLQ